MVVEILTLFRMVWFLDRRKENDICSVLRRIVCVRIHGCTRREKNGENVMNWKKKFALE